MHESQNTYEREQGEKKKEREERERERDREQQKSAQRQSMSGDPNGSELPRQLSMHLMKSFKRDPPQPQQWDKKALVCNSMHDLLKLFDGSVAINVSVIRDQEVLR